MEYVFYQATTGIVMAFFSFNLWTILREYRIIDDNSWKPIACDECFSSWLSIIMSIGLFFLTDHIWGSITVLAFALITVKVLSKQYWS